MHKLIRGNIEKVDVKLNKQSFQKYRVKSMKF
jgi:hypothetical protein